MILTKKKKDIILKGLWNRELILETNIRHELKRIEKYKEKPTTLLKFFKKELNETKAIIRELTK